MAVFDNGFYHSMDQGYYNTPVNCEEAVDTTQSRPKKLGVNELGKTVIDGPNAGRFTQSITAAIREGGSRFELQPIPSQGGGGGGDVDEYGYEEREEIKALAKINKVELTSLHVHHNTVNNLSGQTREGFSEQQRYNSIEEIRRHMNFAADALDGG